MLRTSKHNLAICSKYLNVVFAIVFLLFINISKAQVAPTGFTWSSPNANSITVSSVAAGTGSSPASEGFVVIINTENNFQDRSGVYNRTVGLVGGNPEYSGSGEQVVWAGNGSNPNVTITGLDSNTPYFISIVGHYTGGSVATEYSTNYTLGVATCGHVPDAVTGMTFTKGVRKITLNSITDATGSAGYLVKINTTNSFTDPNAIESSLPTASAAYSGSGEQVVYAGASASPALEITGLNSTVTTEYFFKVYSYSQNCVDGNYYFETTGFEAKEHTCGPPPAGYNEYLLTGGGTYQARRLAPIYSRMNTLDPSGMIVYINDVNNFTAPSAKYKTLPTANADYVGSGQQAVVVGGPSSYFATTNNLIPNTTYYFRSYTYYTCGDTSYVNTSDFKEITLKTCDFSDNTISNPVFGNISASSMELNSFTALSPTAPATAPDGYVIRMNTANSFSPIANGTSVPSGDTEYAGSGEQVIYSGNSTSPNLNITGLSANTTYYFNVVAYYPSCQLNGILYQQAGYTFSKSNNSGLVAPSITFNDIAGTVGGADFNLSATSNSGGTISYQILDQTGVIPTTLSGANNATVTLGSEGTVTIEATQAPSGGYAGGKATVTLTINAIGATISGNPFMLINSILDLSSQITSNSSGVITYSIVGADLGASINGSTLTSVGSTGNIIIKVSQAATTQYRATEFYTLALIHSSGNFKFDRAFNLFDMTVNGGESIQLNEASSYQNGSPVIYSIVGSDPTGSSVNNMTNVFTAGSPGTVTLRASSPDASLYNASTKDVTITIVGTPQTITFNALSDVTYGDANFNLSASASSGLAVSYASSNTSVATVSGSTVTIVGDGTTNITASQVGNTQYEVAANVVQSLRVNAISISDQTVTINTTGSGLCGTTATVSLASTQSNLNYYLRNNADDSVIEGPVAGTGSGISFASEALSSSRTYNVVAVQNNQALATAANKLEMTTTPTASVQPLVAKNISVSQPDGSSATVSVANSQTGVSYYLQDNATNEALETAITGTGSTISFANNTITADRTYKVVATDANANHGVRHALKLDNVDDYVSIPAINAHLTNASQATIETWVKIPASDASDVNASIITAESYVGDLASVVVPFYINISGGNIFAGRYDNDFDDGGTYNTATYTYPVDTWFHVAATLNINGSITFYVNGNLIGSVGSTYGFESYVLTSNLRLGSNYQGAATGNQLFGGQLAQTRIWDGVRTPAQITADMNTVFTSPQTNLVLNYNYNQTTGTSVSDASGNSITGTLQNGTGDATNWRKDLFTTSICGFVPMSNTVSATFASLQEQTITFNALSDVVIGGASFDLTASGGGSGNPITYTSSNTSVATISGNTVTIVGVGTTNITASQAGNASYLAATDVVQSLTVAHGNYEQYFVAQHSIYGVTNSGSSYLVKTLSSSEGQNIEALLRVGGQIWGTANLGGANNKGTLFRMDADGTNFTKLHDFTVAEGNPRKDLELVADAEVYGIVGSYGVFKVPVANPTSMNIYTGYTGTNSFTTGVSYHGGYVWAVDDVQSMVGVKPDFSTHIIGVTGIDATYQGPNSNLLFEGHTMVCNNDVNVQGAPDLFQPWAYISVGAASSWEQGTLADQLLLFNASPYGDKTTRMVYGDDVFYSVDLRTAPDVYRILSYKIVDTMAVIGGLERTFVPVSALRNDIGANSWASFTEPYVTIHAAKNNVVYGVRGDAATGVYEAFEYSMSTNQYVAYNIGASNLTVGVPNEAFFGFAKTATIIGKDATMAYGGTVPTYTYDVWGLENGDNASVLGSVSAQSREVPRSGSSPAIPVSSTTHPGQYPIILFTDTSASNYNLRHQFGTLTITYAIQSSDLDFSLTSGALEYDGNAKTFQAVGKAGTPAGPNTGNAAYLTDHLLSSDFNYEYFVSTNGGTTYTSLGTIAPSTVGMYRVTATVKSDNSIFNGAVSHDFSITKRPLTLTADAKSKVYGSTDPKLTYQITSGSLLTATDTSDLSLRRVAGENVGKYKIDTVGFGSLTVNYSVTYIADSLTITPKAITITADAKTKVYGETDPSLTYQITTGSLETEDVLTGLLSRAVGEDVNTYAISSTLANSNYNITYVGANLSITKAILTVSVVDTIMEQGAAVPIFRTTFTGFKGADNESMLDTKPSISSPASSASVAGEYSIFLSGGSDNNYNFSLRDGTLTIIASPSIIATTLVDKIGGAAIAPNHVYRLQDSVWIEVTYDKKISVVGRPYIQLTSLSNKYAVFDSLVSPDSLKAYFLYKISTDEDRVGLSDPNVPLTIASSINLNGGSIKDQYGFNASLDISGLTVPAGTITDAYNSLAELDDLSLYPIPFKNSFVIELPFSAYGDYQMTILDQSGKVLVVKELSATTLTYEVHEMQQYGAGLYLVQLSKGNVIKSYRIIKQ